MAEGFLETHSVASAFVPVDMQTADNDGDWGSVGNNDRICCFLFKGAGTAGDDPIINIQQADSAAGGNAKDLTFTVIHTKVGSQVSTNDWTRVTQNAATSYTDAVSAEAEAMFMVEFKADELDIDNGFKWVRIDIADVGSNAQLGCAWYVAYDGRYQGQTPPDIIS